MKVATLKSIFSLAWVFSVAIAEHLDEILFCSQISRDLQIDKVIPTNYSIRLEVIEFEKVSGTSNITIQVKKPTRDIKLNFRELRVDSVNITRLPDPSGRETNEPVKLLHSFHCDQAQILVLVFDIFLLRGQYNLYLAFSSPITDTGIIYYIYDLKAHNKT